VGICTRNPLCTAIQTWGVTDAHSWIPSTFPGFGAALPFTAAYEPKPSYNAMREALAAAPAVARVALPAAFVPPAIESRGLGNAASYTAGGVTPGEIVVLYFAAARAPALTVASLGAESRYPAVIAETQLLFDGVPARLLYAAQDRVAGFAPFSLTDRETTRVEMEYQGIRSNAIVVPVLRAKPGIFTMDASGKGLAAALHPDYSLVSAAKPATKGGIVSLFMTGAGVTDPPGVDGQVITGGPLPMPQQAVTATIGGKQAEVLYAGGAVGLPHGGFQVNVRIPTDLPSGNQNIVIRIGEASSGPDVTVPVE
jgi:uncharacterized protein (TIGR03437 family)